ncbi:hypothetical protein NDU88_005004 [Pleurodeles waltl]|uniref:Uncharacterized protein n=1 Tax=Pleurodeles waltl TaxID=8319 RepID=A0AAV7LJZ0_PLEWA|nr:hypothetical protein NDU88_005004 [Pleurodeles waltl]
MPQGPDHTSRLGPPLQSAHGPQPRPPPSSLLQGGGGVGEAQAPPESSAFPHSREEDAWEQARSAVPLPRAALHVEPPSLRKAADPPHWVQATGPGMMGGGPDHTTLRGPPATPPSVPLPPPPWEVRGSSPVSSRGSPPTRGSAQKCLGAARGVAAPQVETPQACGPPLQAPAPASSRKAQAHPRTSRTMFWLAARPRRSLHSRGAGRDPEMSQGGRA